jgi:hypothetical protein
VKGSRLWLSSLLLLCASCENAILEWTQTLVSVDGNPQVESFVVPTGQMGKSFKAGQVITIYAFFNETITVNDSGPNKPSLMLNTGRLCNYVVGGATSRALKFTYTVAAGDNQTVLNIGAASPFSLNDAIVKDSEDNLADPIFPDQSDLTNSLYSQSVSVDTTNPYLQSIDATKSGQLNLISPNDAVDFRLTYSEPVIFPPGVPATLTLNLSNGRSLTSFTHAGNIIIFHYQLLPDENEDTQGADLQISSITGPTGLFLHDAAGNDVNYLAIPALSASLTVDINLPPSVPSALGVSFSNSTPDTLIVTWTDSAFSTNPSTGFEIEVTEIGGPAPAAPTPAPASVLSVNSFQVTGLKSGATYKFRVRAINASGTSAYSAYTNPSNGLVPLVVQDTYPNHPMWNDYVLSLSASDFNHGADTLCPSPTETRTCIHSGERKKVIAYGYETSCSPILSIHTALSGSVNDVFDWTDCVLESGKATFYSTGLAQGKGLKDLFTSAGAKKAFTVELISNYSAAAPTGTLLASSSSAPLVSNSTASLVTTTGGVTSIDSTQAGKIYTFSGNHFTGGINIDADRVSIVSLDGGELELGFAGPNSRNSDGEFGTGADLRTVITAGSQSGLWIESPLNGNAIADNILYFNNVRNSRIHLSKIHETNIVSPNAAGIRFIGAQGNRVTNFAVGKTFSGIKLISSNANLFSHGSSMDNHGSASISHGIDLTSSNKNKFVYVSTSNNQSSNIFFDNSSTENVLSSIVSSSSNMFGIEIDGYANTVVRSTFANNRMGGLAILGGGENIFHSILAVRNGSLTAGLIVANSANNTFSQMMAILNGGHGVRLETASIDNKFTGNLIAAYNFDDVGTLKHCFAVAGSGLNPSPSEDCSPAVNSNNAIPPLDGGIFNPSLAWTSFGAANHSSPAETTNTSNTDANTHPSGTDYTSLVDVFKFDDIFENWGLRAFGGQWPLSNTTGVWPDTHADQGACAAGTTCTLYDWALNQSSGIRNTSWDGINQNSAEPSGIGGGCSTQQLAAPLTTHDGDQTFDMLTAEFIGDYLGDDDGLCEDGEACIYLPNFGAYQGDGSFDACVAGNHSGVQTQDFLVYYFSSNGRSGFTLVPGHPIWETAE